MTMRGDAHSAGVPPVISTATQPSPPAGVPERGHSRTRLVAAQAVGQGTRISFHLLAASSLGFSQYGKFIVVFSLAVVVATFVGLGMRHRMQLIHVSSRTPTQQWIVLAAAVPLACGLAAAAVTASLSAVAAWACLLAIGFASTEIASESLKGEGRPTLAIWMPSVALFAIPTLALLIGAIDSSQNLIYVSVFSGCVFVPFWITVRTRQYGWPKQFRALDWAQIQLSTIASAALMQLATQLPVFFLAAVSDEAAGQFAIALRTVGLIGVTAGAIGTPIVRNTAQAFWQSGNGWPIFEAGLKRIAGPTVALGFAVAAVIANPFNWSALESDGLRTYAWILLPAILIGALCGPVTATLFATNRTRPILTASVLNILTISIGGVLGLRATSGVPIAIAIAAGLALQNLYQLWAVRTTKEPQ